MVTFLNNTLGWIKDDFKSHPTRFIIECVAWAAYTRKSFGMLANYLLLTTIGLMRMLWQG